MESPNILSKNLLSLFTCEFLGVVSKSFKSNLKFNLKVITNYLELPGNLSMESL